MKFIYFFLSILLVSCKTTKNTESNAQLINAWSQVNEAIDDDEIKPDNYFSYTLNENEFSKQLAAGLVYLPITNNQFAVFEVENSSTMTAALQLKFPQLKSYKGVQQNNTLCQCRIDENNLDFKITILCNDATFYVNDLFKNKIYFFYNKQDLPAGVGQINE